MTDGRERNKMIENSIDNADQTKLETSTAVARSSPLNCYTSDFFSLYQQDCMEGMKQYPDNHFELAIVDPPYNIVSQQKRGIGSRIDPTGKMNDWNNKKPSPAYFSELFRASKVQIIWGANNFDLPTTEYFVVWDKMQTVDNFASAEYAWTNYRMPAKVFRYGIHKEIANRVKIHPTQKPVKLYEWLLKNYAKEGDKILDTHLGSGSSVIACYNLDFHLTGFEIDEDYFKAMKHRIKEHMKQGRLFDANQEA